MAITKVSNSGFKSGMTKYDSLLANYPGKMAAPTATDGGTGTTASIAFTTVSGATGYQVLSSPGSITATGTSSPITVSGLTTGTAYTFQIQAQNSSGYGGYSDASNSVTPAIPPVFESIATFTPSSGTSSITFSSIPQTYASLQIRMLVRNNGTSYGNGNGELRMRFNGVTTTTYDRHYLYGNGTSAVGNVDYTSNDFSLESSVLGGNTLSNTYAPSIIDIIDYASTTKNKTARVFAGGDANAAATNYMVRMTSLGWRNTAAISSITLSDNSGSGFASGCSFALYGIKGS